MSTPFEILNISEMADDATVHTAYLRAVRANPPDRDPERFQAIRTAFETVRTKHDRLRYRLFNTRPPSVASLLQFDLAETSPTRLTLTQLRQVLRASANVNTPSD